MEHLRAHIALFLVALIYAGNYSIAKRIMGPVGLDPHAFILLRALSGTLILGLAHRLWIRQQIARSDLPRLILCALTGIAINQLCFFSGLDRTTPIHAALIMTTCPIMVLLLSIGMGTEPFNKRRGLGILLAAGGAVYLILGPHTLTMGTEYWKGDLLVAINACSYALYLILVRDLMRRYHPITVISWLYPIGLIFIIPWGAGPLLETDFSHMRYTDYLCIAYVLVLVSCIAYVLNGYGLGKIAPSAVSVYIYLQPLLAGLISIWLGHDVLDGVLLIAGIFIIGGVILATLKPSHRAVEKNL